MEQYKVGDAVRILDDIARVHDLQENHGGWIDDMALVRKRNITISRQLLFNTILCTRFMNCASHMLVS